MSIVRCRNNARRVVLAWSLCWWALTTSADAQTTIPYLERPPTLDDIASGAPADGWLVAGQFVQRDPNDGEPATVPTRAWVSRDASHLYVGFVCVEEPSKVRARLSRRDAITQDDQVTVMIDTFHDRQRAYVFAVNPLGVQADALASEGRDDDFSFDTVWRSSGRLLDNGYAALIAIPFKSLRLSTVANAEWGLALGRTTPRTNEQVFWPPITRRIEGLMQQFATVQQPHGVSGGRNLQVIPYASVSDARTLDLGRSAYYTGTARRLGVDAKLVVKDAVAVDVAVNPDFSQIESDQPQIAVNQRFELFYPERRPFFLENASMFKYVRTAQTDPTTRMVPEMLFFSRRIYDPSIGLRATGKIGSWSFGSLAAVDRGAQAASLDDAAIGVGRAQFEFANQSTLGAFVTTHDRQGERNSVAAVDVRWKLSPNWVASGQAMASRTGLADGRVLAGPAYNAAVHFTSRKTLYTLFYSDRGPTFRTALGFVPRVDFRQIEQYSEHRWRPRTGPVVAFGPNSYVRVNWDHTGRLQEWIVRYPFELHLKGRTQVFVRRVEAYELFQGVGLRQRFQTINVSTEWFKRLSVTEGFEWGRTPNYFPAAGTAPYVADALNVSLGLTWRPTPRARVEQTMLHSRLRDRPLGPSRAIFSTTVARSTAHYQFTRALALRLIADYNAVVPNPALVRLTHDRKLGADVLLSYQTGPSTAVYVGWATGWQNVSLAGEGSAALRTDQPTTETGRRLFVKLSYMMRP